MSLCLLVEGVLLEETLQKKIAVNWTKKYHHWSMGKLGISTVSFPNVFFMAKRLSITTKAVEYHRPSQNTSKKQYAKRKEQVTHLIYKAYLQKTIGILSSRKNGKMPTHNEMKCVLSIKESYSKGGKGQNCQKCLWEGLGALGCLHLSTAGRDMMCISSWTLNFDDFPF